MEIKLPEFKRFGEGTSFLGGTQKEWKCQLGNLCFWIVYVPNDGRYAYGIDFGQAGDNKDIHYRLGGEKTYQLVCADLVEIYKKWLSQHVDTEE